jgi:hypothetical protein
MASPVHPKIDEAIRCFTEIYVAGIPLIIRDRTAFLAFICMLTATDALAGYRYNHPKPGPRFRRFLRTYFPPSYASHVPKLWLFRCRMVHGFSPAYFTLTHHDPRTHLSRSAIGDTTLNAESFHQDFARAATTFFAEVRASSQRQKQMLARLTDIAQGGGIAVV